MFLFEIMKLILQNDTHSSFMLLRIQKKNLRIHNLQMYYSNLT